MKTLWARLAVVPARVALAAATAFCFLSPPLAALAGAPALAALAAAGAAPPFLAAPPFFSEAVGGG